MTERESFKLRMQQLKTYREQNPGKGYLDFKLYADGGEVPPTKPTITDQPIKYKGKLYSDRYGKLYTEDQVNLYYNDSSDEIDRFTGQPFVKGIKGALNLEDVANLTPVGDAISVKDTYDAVKNRDWASAGLAAISLLPFVPNVGKKVFKPMTVKEFRKNYKGVTPKATTRELESKIPSVNRNYVQDRINEMNKIEELRAYKNELQRSTAANLKFRIVENIMEDPSYVNRAELVKKEFGDDYGPVYGDMVLLYNEDPDYLPKVISEELPKGTRACMALDDAGRYNYRIDPDQADLSKYLSTHEMGHYADLKRNRNRPDPHGDSNMFYLMTKDLLNKKVDAHDNYFKMPTELKAHMNLLREFMYDNNFIRTRDLNVDPDLLLRTLNEIGKDPEFRSVVRASKLFKNISKYTKWFNSIPILGLGAAAMYKNNNQE